MERMAELLADTFLKKGAVGVYGPTINLQASAFVGRNSECGSECPILSGKMVAAYCRGFQSEGGYVYMKHFAFYRMCGNASCNSWVNEQAVREIYTRQFELGVKEGDAHGMMISFARLGTSLNTCNERLLTNLARGEWVLFVDADEAVSPELREQILAAFRRGVPEAVAGFSFPRQVWFLHRWIRHGDWYPDTKLRLFRKARGRCCGIEPHERVEVDGEVRHLRAPLYHYTYDDIADQLDTLNRFTSIGAASAAQGKRRSRLFVLWGMLLHPPFRFFRCYFLKLGFLDGVAGLVIARSAAFSTFLKYAKLWEARLERGARGEDPENPAT